MLDHTHRKSSKGTKKGHNPTNTTTNASTKETINVLYYYGWFEFYNITSLLHLQLVWSTHKK